MSITDEKIVELIELSKSAHYGRRKNIKKNDDGEELIDQNELEKIGLRCEPFWESANDIEGDCYREHIKKHPDFSLSVRRTVADMLIKAQKSLPQAWKIVLKAGYRPLEVQLELLKVLKKISERSHPEWSEGQHLGYARKYVADPSIVCPPHVTGGAVDIDVYDTASGSFVDMGCRPNTEGELATLHSKMLNPDQYHNRIVLLSAMLRAGFAPLSSEWWHYQYGETYWAEFYGISQTYYYLISEN